MDEYEKWKQHVDSIRGKFNNYSKFSGLGAVDSRPAPFATRKLRGINKAARLQQFLAKNNICNEHFIYAPMTGQEF